MLGRLKTATQALLACAMILLIIDWLFPPPTLSWSYSTRVLDRNGVLIWRFASEDEKFRDPYLTPNPQLEDILIAFEDRRFYQHFGVDPLALARAVGQAIAAQKVVSGASTITMQLARLNENLGHGLGDKIWQLLRALQYEWRYDKAEILRAYLERIPMGGNIEGVSAAARLYFDRRVDQLTLSQALVLAGIPQHPQRFRPDINPQHTLEQRNKLLSRYAAVTALEPSEQRIVLAQSTLTLAESNRRVGYWSAERLRQADPQSATLESTLDAKLQQQLEAIVDHDPMPKEQAMAILVIDNARGQVLARVGNRTELYGKTQYFDLSRAIRSPGSTLKPFVYAMALDQKLIHSASLLADAPIDIGGYRPGNFNHQFHGAVSAAEALQHSLNIPAVFLLNRLGVENFVERITPLGLKRTEGDANLSIVLGGTGSTLESLVGAYRLFAKGGKAITPSESPSSTPEISVLSEQAAFIVHQMLSDIPPPNADPNLRGIAWKTGTSYAARDAWAIGVSADFTVGVWQGAIRGQSKSALSGYQDAGNILFRTFALLPQDQHRIKQPKDLSQSTICWPSGRTRDSVRPEHCTIRQKAWLIDGIAPATLDTKPGEWPEALKHWRADSRVDTTWTAAPKIITLQDKQRVSLSQTITLQANAQTEVAWYLDGVYLPEGKLEPGLSAGEHRLTVTDRYGRADSLQFLQVGATDQRQ